jgi:predicted ATPase
MKTLVVSDFSCIQKATLELSQLTLIIGPQASGKSVLCKLAYFLFDCAQLQQKSIVKKESFERFVSDLKERFIEWFPPSAWGNKRFKIELTAGEYSVLLARKTYGGKVSDDFRVKFSQEFQNQYEALLAIVQNAVQKERSPGVRAIWEFDWELRQTIAKSLKQIMKKDSVGYQAFVPAGRSFFTSIGKAIAAFEQGRVLDPLILHFGRMYTSFREHDFYIGDEKASETALRKSIEKSMAQLLGGVIERDGEKDFVRADDGRKIPLSALSSGQQELLPLIAFMPWLYRAGVDRQCYIEEPEAHLFPSAQSRLIESLVVASSSTTVGAGLVLTTHSPYVLTKVNNLLKAGAIAKRLNDIQRKDLEQIVPRRAWLQAKNVRAYAIHEGRLISILESDGLVSADYLDEVSGELGREFGALLTLEESIV